MIGPGEVTRIISEGKVVDEYLAIITAYRPGALEWEQDYKTRRRR
jgi:hypothetical protein